MLRKLTYLSLGIGLALNGFSMWLTSNGYTGSILHVIYPLSSLLLIASQVFFYRMTHNNQYLIGLVSISMINLGSWAEGQGAPIGHQTLNWGLLLLSFVFIPMAVYNTYNNSNVKNQEDEDIDILDSES